MPAQTVMEAKLRFSILLTPDGRFVCMYGEDGKLVEPADVRTTTNETEAGEGPHEEMPEDEEALEEGEAPVACSRAGCHATSKAGLCADCKTVAYCSAECQRADWYARHSKQCAKVERGGFRGGGFGGFRGGGFRGFRGGGFRGGRYGYGYGFGRGFGRGLGFWLARAALAPWLYPYALAYWYPPYAFVPVQSNVVSDLPVLPLIGVVLQGSRADARLTPKQRAELLTTELTQLRSIHAGVMAARGVDIVPDFQTGRYAWVIRQ